MMPRAQLYYPLERRRSRAPTRLSVEPTPIQRLFILRTEFSLSYFANLHQLVMDFLFSIICARDISNETFQRGIYSIYSRSDEILNVYNTAISWYVGYEILWNVRCKLREIQSVYSQTRFAKANLADTMRLETLPACVGTLLVQFIMHDILIYKVIRIEHNLRRSASSYT